jgi:hypothetical protein
MHSPHSTLLVAQQRIADLHRAADHQRLAHSTMDARPTHADAPATFVRRLRRHLTHPLAASR